MSAMSHRPEPEAGMNPSTRQSHFRDAQAGEGNATLSTPIARLQVIHDLIRSGDYHVPATAIADRMIEQMMVEKRGCES
jgi:anti-sigma28 factor (negative regulator of flagellin synthesis)